MIKRLSVRALGPIESADLNGDAPVTLVLGPNEAGKSTLLEALQVLYFGTRGDVAVKENAVLTRAGAKGWSIEAEWDDGTVLRATRSQRPLQAEILAKLGDPRVFRALGHLDSFLAATPAERKALLADLAAQDTAELAERARHAGASADVLAALASGNVKRAQALVTEQRREKVRAFKALEALAGEEVPCPEVETKQGFLAIDRIALEQIEPGIARLSKRRDEIRAAVLAAARWDRESEDVRAAQAELEDLDAEAIWADGDEAALLSKQRELEGYRAASTAAHHEIAVAVGQENALESLMESAGPCPTCQAPLGNIAAQTAIKAARSECVKRIDKLRKVQQEALDAARPIEQAMKEMRDRRQRAAALATVKARLEERIARMESVGEKPSIPAGDVEELSVEISRLNRMRDLRREWETRTSDKQRAKARLEELARPTRALAELEAMLDPTAIADEGALLTEINGHLARTCGKLGVPVVLNDGYELSIHGRPAGLASDSARIRAGFGVACALAVLSGVGMAFLDRFESLDDTNRKAVLGLLKGLVDDGLLEWVLIAAVKENPVKVGNVPWLASVTVKGGTATYLGE